MTKTVTKVLSLLLLFLSPLFGACADSESPYPIKEAPIRPFPDLGYLIWLDNTQVLVSGYKELIPGPKGKAPKGYVDAGIYVWDTEQGTARREPSLENAGRLCIQGEYRSFIRRAPGSEKKWEIVAGTPGNEEVRLFPSKYWFNPKSCRYYDSKPQWVQDGHRRVPLLDEHGYLDLGGSFGKVPNEEFFRNSPGTFFQPGREPGFELSIGRRYVSSSRISYVPFKNAYFIWASAYIDEKTGRETNPYPTGSRHPIWWLTPDGQVTSGDIPVEPWMGASYGLHPTKVGLFVDTRSAKGFGRLGDAGGYLLQGRQKRKLIGGLLEKVAVSPDGCRIVFVHDPYVKKPVVERLTLKVVDVCSERGKGER